MAILVDQKTASSGELCAAVLRAWYPKSVVLVGTKTFGKGVMQEVSDKWVESLGVQLRITHGNFFPVGDTSIHIQGNGLTPDRVIDPFFMPFAYAYAIQELERISRARKARGIVKDETRLEQ